MAIKNKEGFDFFTDKNGTIESFILTGSDLDKELNYIIKNDIKSLSIDYFTSNKINNLDFLSRLSFIESISITDLDLSLDSLYFLKNLKYLQLGVKSKYQRLDFTKFSKLETLSIDWYNDFADLSKNEHLKELIIWKFRPRSKSFKDLNLPNSLERLEITESNIINLEGLDIQNLTVLEAHYCNHLQSITGIHNISKKLETLVFDYCRKLSDYNELGKLKNLNKLILGDCGEIENLDWLDSLEKLEFFSFYNTTVLSNDLSKCVGIKDVSFKDRKGYSHKLNDFTQT